MATLRVGEEGDAGEDATRVALDHGGAGVEPRDVPLIGRLVLRRAIAFDVADEEDR